MLSKTLMILMTLLVGGCSNNTSLDLRNKELTSVDSVKWFIDIETLDLRDNNITDITPLMKLPKLTKVLLGNNPINRTAKVNAWLTTINTDIKG